jgi:hypothetical protein
MRLSHPFHFILTTCLLGAAACDGAGSSGDVTSATSGSGGQGGAPVFRGDCESTNEIGFFNVQHELDISVVSGEVLDGVVPSKILQEVGKEGDCTLLQRKNPFCSPACNPGQTCSQESTCVPFPLTKSVGPVSVTGLEKAVAMSPPSYFDTKMPHPAFVPGAAITLKAEGGDFPGFRLFGQGFAPIVIPKETWVLKKGEPLAITWTPDTSAEFATIRLRLNIDQHGNSPVELVCELKDTGSATIPASLIDKLLGFGVTGFPSGHVNRHTLDSTTVGPGCVRFEVFSHVLGDLQVADHIPCDAATPCPMGMTCDEMIGTCL